MAYQTNVHREIGLSTASELEDAFQVVPLREAERDEFDLGI